MSLQSLTKGRNKAVRDVHEAKGCTTILFPLIGAIIGVVFIGNGLADVKTDGAAVKAFGWGVGAFVGGLAGFILHRFMWFGNDVSE